MKKRRDSKEMARELNIIRKANLGREMNKTEMCELINKVLPKDNGTIPVCVKLGIVVRPKRGHYKFSEEAIHYTKLDTFYANLKKRVSKNAAIEQAINLLEKNGFIVTYNPLIPNGTRLSDALEMAKKFGYTVIKN